MSRRASAPLWVDWCTSVPAPSASPPSFWQAPNSSLRLKLVGAAYLLWLGIKTIREAHVALLGPVESTGAMRAFRQGTVVEALNPKTAAFFLAFIPQFIEPDTAHVALQFVVLGLISVTLNTAADIVVVLLASAARAGLSHKPQFIRRLRQGAGLIISGLGLSLALTSRPGPH